MFPVLGLVIFGDGVFPFVDGFTGLYSLEAQIDNNFRIFPFDLFYVLSARYRHLWLQCGTRADL
jgi:hypothetical protein